MKLKPVLMVLLMVAAIGWMFFRISASRQAPETKSVAQAVPTPPQGKSQPIVPPTEVVTETAPVTVTSKESPQTPAARPRVARLSAPQEQIVIKPKKQKPPILDATARDALSYVGMDPDAEDYWVSAINNPNLPAEERKDLIEDLNEDGLSDPKNPGFGDLPLILNRIELIEELAPNSMDAVNAAAFAEAYKDLNNMLAGQPVK